MLSKLSNKLLPAVSQPRAHHLFNLTRSVQTTAVNNNHSTNICNVSNSSTARNISTSTPLAQGAAAASVSSATPNAELEKQRKLFEERNARRFLHDDELIGMNGGQIFAEMMRQHGVKQIFGYPGGAILPIFDGIYQNEFFKFCLPRHEQGAGHMAEGYARATGQPGICVVTSGPGATNCITPMQDALSDGTPMIVFTGQVPTTAIGSDAFQEADVLGISRHCTKWNSMVKDIADLPRVIRQAFLIATSGRPGPVLVDLPKDVTSATLTRSINKSPSVPSFYKFQLNEAGRKEAQLAAVEEAIVMINKSQRPVLYVGQGALDYSALVSKFSEAGNIPVTTTLQAMGAFDELSPRSLHMLGMHGSSYANLAIQNADCIVAIGARFDDRVTGNIKKFAPAARKAAAEGRGGIIHLELVNKNINKVVQVDVGIEGDCGESMKLIFPHIKSQPRTEWFDKINEWKRKFPYTYGGEEAIRASPNLLKPQHVLEELDRQVSPYKENVIMTTGVGQHQMWAAQFYRWRYPRTFITSGGLGTMGYGLPSAIGAKVAKPESIVIDVDGDASFSMTAMEMATAAEYNIAVKVLILNNNFQGMVKQW
jgi:acetolactate synthase-1/2/3 large subunit